MSQIHDPHHTNHIGAIVGGVVGGVLFLFILSVFILVFRKRATRTRQAEPQTAPIPFPSQSHAAGMSQLPSMLMAYGSSSPLSSSQSAETKPRSPGASPFLGELPGDRLGVVEQPAFSGSSTSITNPAGAGLPPRTSSSLRQHNGGERYTPPQGNLLHLLNTILARLPPDINADRGPPTQYEGPV